MVRSTAPEAATSSGASTSRGPLLFHWVAPFVSACLGVWMVRRMWGPGLIAGADSTAIVVRTDRTIRDVLAHGHLNGWSPYFSNGHDAFLINPPGFSVIIAVIRVASFGQLSTIGAIKIAILLSFVALPFSVASFARSVGADRRAASLTGILSLVVSVFAGFGIRGVFETGLYPFQAAAPLFFFALGAIVNACCEPSIRRATIGALWVAALVLTHILMATVLVYCAACALLVMYLSRRATFGLRSCTAMVGVGLGAAALCAFWLFPFLQHRHLAGRAATWVPPPFHEQVADVLEGHRLYDEALANLVIAGWIFVLAVALRGRRRGLIPCAIAAGSIVAVHVVRGRYPGDVTSQMPWRAVTSIGVIALIPAATMVVTVSDWFGALVQAVGHRVRPLDAIGRHRVVLAELLGVAVCAGLVVGIDQRANLPGDLTEPIPEMRQTAQLLHTLVPVTGRFAVEEDFPAEIGRLGVISPGRWLAWASGRNELNVFNPELNHSAAGTAAREVHSAAPGMAQHLASLGVTHIVSTSDETAQRLEQSGDVTLLESRGPLRIWQTKATDKVDPRALLSVDNGTLEASYERQSNEHHRFVANVSAPTTVGIAIAYSPRWQLTVDGRALTPQSYGDGRIKFELDAGRHEIRLDYGTDWRTVVGGLVSLAALLLALSVLWRTRRQKIRDAIPA